MSDMVFATEYMSDFDFESDRSSQADSTLSQSRHNDKSGPDIKVPARGLHKGHQSEVLIEYSREEWKRSRQEILSMNAYDRHKKMVNDYIRFYGGKMTDFHQDKGTDKSEMDIVRQNHRFLWASNSKGLSWEQRVAKKYWDKLYKEYCIADLSLYKEDRIAMRWRIEKEVISGKGQFICGNKKCSTDEGLRSWEVNFGYTEDNEKKNALVKLRLCPPCSYKLNYKSQRREVKRKRCMKDKGKERRESQDALKLKSGKRQKVGDDKSNESATIEDAVTTNIWSRPVDLRNEKSAEEEVDEYLKDMGVFL